MHSIRKLYATLFQHSLKRTIYVIVAAIVFLALPITIILVQQQQDLRQRAQAPSCASGNVCGAGCCPRGWECLPGPPPSCLDPNEGQPPPEDTGYIPDIPPASQGFGAQCQTFTALSPSGYPTWKYAGDNCNSPYRCEQVLGQGNICVEPPSSGSRTFGQHCRDDFECASGLCFYAPGATGVSTCQNQNFQNNGSFCGRDIECKSKFCLKQTVNGQLSPTGICRDKCGPSNCSGTCNNITNECTAPPTPTNTPTPVVMAQGGCNATTGRQIDCECQTSNQCQSGYCGMSGSSQGSSSIQVNTCQNPPISPTTPSQQQPNASITPPGNTTRIAFSVKLPGVGAKTATNNDNPNPNRTSREATVQIIDSLGNVIQTVTTNTIFNVSDYVFKGTADLGSNFESGTYGMKVKLDNTPYNYLNPYIVINKNFLNTAPNIINLSTGDLNQNNGFDLIDYNLFRACEKKLATCNESLRIRADLNDDGQIGDLDEVIMLRGFFAQGA